MGVRVNKCCFCYSLRTGSLIIGYLGAIGFSILSIMLLIASVTLGKVASMAANDMERFRQKLTPEKYHELEAAVAAAPALLIMSVLMMLFLALTFGFYIALIMGVQQKKPNYVKVFTVFTLVFIVIDAIYLIADAFTSANKMRTVSFNLINLAWSIYTWIVVRSYYHELKEGVEGRNPTNTNKYP